MACFKEQAGRSERSCPMSWRVAYGRELWHVRCYRSCLLDTAQTYHRLLAGTQERLHMDELKQKRKRESVEKAADALKELASICNSLRPTDRLKLQKKEACCHIPAGQCKLAILPGDSAEGGKLQVEVRSEPGFQLQHHEARLAFVVLYI